MYDKGFKNMYSMRSPGQVTIHKQFEGRIMFWSKRACNYSKYNFLTYHFITNYSTLAGDTYFSHMKSLFNTRYS